MTCASDQCQQGRLVCPTPGYCHAEREARLSVAMNAPIDRRDRVLTRYNELADADAVFPSATAAIASLFGLIAMLAIFCLACAVAWWMLRAIWPILRSIFY